MLILFLIAAFTIVVIVVAAKTASPKKNVKQARSGTALTVNRKVPAKQGTIPRATSSPPVRPLISKGGARSGQDVAGSSSASMHTVPLGGGMKLTISVAESVLAPIRDRAGPGDTASREPADKRHGGASDSDYALAWVPFDRPITVSRLTIPSAGTYTSALGKTGRGDPRDPSEIVRKLRFTLDGDAAKLDYWPWYGGLSMAQRGRYLRWLAEGRRHLPVEDGYLFIYFYGLERRALVDRADLEAVYREALRLRQLHFTEGEGRGWSFRGYCTSFLWFLTVRDPELVPPALVSSLAGQMASASEDNLAAMLAWCSRKEMCLGASVAMVVASVLPQSQRSVVTKRVGDEFKELFIKRYKAEFGPGIELEPAARERTFAYRPASNALSVHSTRAPSPWGRPAQFNRLADLWNSCVADLKGLSRVSAAGGTSLSVERWEAMPPELRAGVDHPLTEAVCSVVSAHHAGGAECIIEIGKLAEAVGVEPTAKLTVVRSRKLAQIFHDVGYALEPDARLTGQGYAKDDEVAVFLRTDDQEPDAKRYAGAAWTLRLGLAIAGADGAAEDEEIRRVTSAVYDTFDLSDADRRRLEALRAVLIRSASDLSGLGKKVQAALPPPARLMLGKLLVAVAAADGVIQPNELSALRKCYRAMDLLPDQLDAALAELVPASDEGLEVVSPGSTGSAGRPGEPIPAPPPAGTVQLNREAIRRILAETEQVRKVLAEAMSGVEEPSNGAALPPGAPPAVVGQTGGQGPSGELDGRVRIRFERFVETDPDSSLKVVGNGGGSDPAGSASPQAPGGPTAGHGETGVTPVAPVASIAVMGVAGTSVTSGVPGIPGLPGLRPQFEGFYAELMTRTAWAAADAKALAQRHRVMLSGAVEAVNEAAFESLGRQLVYEDGDGLTVEPPLRKDNDAWRR